MKYFVYNKLYMRQTKIICTIGPSVNTKAKIIKLFKSGMNCARLNFSHGDYKSHQHNIDMIKEIRNELGVALPILLDTKGPEIRVKQFENGCVTLKTGQTFTLDTLDKKGDNKRVGITFNKLADNVKVGTKIIVDDGKIELKVTKIDGSKVITRVIHGEKISDHKSINVPNTSIKMNYLSEQDKSDLLFGIKNKVDFVAASFSRSKQDMIDLRTFLDNHGGKKIEIIAKIENREGVRNYKKILEVADGIMVARGDLGVEIPFREIPTVQKTIVSYCNEHGKLAVVATQMLESMTQAPRPTRAEVSDVANAIFDGANAVMLSGETASGKYPFAAVKTMSKISESAFCSCYYRRDIFNIAVKNTLTEGVCKAAHRCADMIKASVITVCSNSGRTAKILSYFRPNIPIFALVADETGFNQLGLYYGVIAYKVKQGSTPEFVNNKAMEEIKKFYGKKYKGKRIVVISGDHFSYGKTDTMSAHTL